MPTYQELEYLRHAAEEKAKLIGYIRAICEDERNLKKGIWMPTEVYELLRITKTSR